LRSTGVDRPASATATFADVQSDFVAELDWLEVAVVMQRLASVARALWIAVSSFIADMLAKLGNASWVSAA
jgi:hypothetical protein